MRKISRYLLLFVLFLGVSFGVLFSSASNTNAYPDLSPDGVTCTPCHEEGFGGGGGAETPATPAEETPSTPTETPAETTEEPAEEPAEAHEPMSPWIVVGGVIVILGVIYFLAIRKK